jgi:prophage regulatory protein
MREPDRIIRLKTVLARTGLSRSTIYRKIAEGTFPAQLKISVNGTGWHESDINRWIADPVAWPRNVSTMTSDSAATGTPAPRPTAPDR